MARARVAHLTTVHHAEDPRVFWKEAVSLAQAGYAVSLVAQHARHERREGVDIVPLPRVRGRYRRMLLQRKVYRAARALEADLYHLHDPELLPVGYALKRATGARVVYDMHENNAVQRGLERALIRRLERWSFSWIDHLVLAEESYEAHVPPSVPRTLVLNYFRPFRRAVPPAKTLGGGPFRLLYAGVLSDDRGLGTMLDLAAEARAARLPWHLTLAGVCYRHADRRRAEARLEREALTGYVARDGWDTYVPWATLEAHYEASHVGLALLDPNPNYAASIPTKFYEYLFYGLPLLCSDFPLWRRFVERHGCGAVVPPGDAAPAAAVLRQWAADPAGYARLSAAAASAARHYLWPAMEARLLALYETLLASPIVQPSSS